MRAREAERLGRRGKLAARGRVVPVMRTSLVLAGLVALAACKEPTTTSAAPAQTASDSTAAASTAPPPAATAPVAPSAPPRFTYVEGTDELAFWSPTTLRLVRSGGTRRTCMSRLSTGNDNMWTGPDVEHALADADVQAALLRGGTQAFLPEIGDGGAVTESQLRTPTATLEWKLTACRWCVAPPAGITRLHQVLAGVMMNRRLLCP